MLPVMVSPARRRSASQGRAVAVGAAYGAVAPVVLVVAICLLGWLGRARATMAFVREVAPYALVALPGAVALGASLGWLLGRGCVRKRLPTMGLGLLAGFVNGGLGGVINAVSGNPCGLGDGSVGWGLLGGAVLFVVLWFICAPLSIAVALLIRRSVAPADAHSAPPE